MEAIFEKDWKQSEPVIAKEAAIAAFNVPAKKVAKEVAKQISIKPVVEQVLDKVIDTKDPTALRTGRGGANRARGIPRRGAGRGEKRSKKWWSRPLAKRTRNSRIQRQRLTRGKEGPMDSSSVFRQQTQSTQMRILRAAASLALLILPLRRICPGSGVLQAPSADLQKDSAEGAYRFLAQGEGVHRQGTCPSGGQDEADHRRRQAGPATRKHCAMLCSSRAPMRNRATSLRRRLPRPFAGFSAKPWTVPRHKDQGQPRTRRTGRASATSK